EMFLQHVMHHLFLGQPKRVIEGADEQWLDRLPFGIFPDAEGRDNALRALKDHLRDLEQGIRAPSHFDLAGERIDAFVIRQQGKRDLRQRWRWFATLPVLVETASRTASPIAART